MGLKKITFITFALTVSLFAHSKTYVQALNSYETGEYDKSFPIILEEANLDNKAAQYRLAEMYEEGKGTKVDYKKAIFWYKKAASKYSFADTKEFTNKSDESLSDELGTQISEDSSQDGAEFALAKMDTNTPETKKMQASFLGGDFFGFKPYDVNYFLPLSYSKDKPRRASATLPPQQLAGTDYEEYNQNIEIEFQISLQKELSFNLFGWNESINVAYTQKVWWQAYDKSGPFRETNYQPEIFMTVPTSQTMDDSIGLKAIQLGYVHESNGQEGYRSRSWNRLYVTGKWQWDNLFLSTRAWYRIPEDKKSDTYLNPGQSIDDIQAQSDGDDNHNIHKYFGYGDINIDYLYEKHQFALMLINNLNTSDNKGAIKFTYAHPLFDSPYTSVYVKLFNGYGDSLIDYNVNVTKAAIGFSFSNGLL